MDYQELSALTAEVNQLEERLARASTKQQALSATYALALARRPPGIPVTWLPDYSGSGPALVVRAWFDPNHFGTSIR